MRRGLRRWASSGIGNVSLLLSTEDHQHPGCLSSVHKPTLSVFLPNFNHARFLPEALRSIENQSYQPLEIIIVDDASTDESVSIIKQFADRCPLVRFKRNDVNRGVIPMVNEILKEARGSHLFCMAADDRLRPEFFDKSMAMLNGHPDAGFCSARSYRMDETGRINGLCPAPLVSKSPCYFSAQDVLHALRRHGNWFLSGTTIWRRRALRESGEFRPELRFFADGFMLQVLALRFGACFIQEPLCEFRHLPGQLCEESVVVEAALPVYEAAEKLMQTSYADLFPADYIEQFKKRALANTVEASIERNNKKHLEYMRSMLSSSTLCDTLLLFFVKLAMGCQSCMAKLYLAKIRHGFWRAIRHAMSRFFRL